VILNRLELDIMQANEIREGVELAFKYNFPAVVIHPNLAGDLIRARGAVRGRFKIIMPVDWPDGVNNGIAKMRGLGIDQMEADGFEVALGHHDEGAIRRDAADLTEFLKTQIGRDQPEVRFVLGVYNRSDDSILQVCRGLTGVRTPALLRLDTKLKLQVNKANTDEHNRIASLIRSVLPTPIKVVGNVNGVRNITACKDANRFGVNLLQARTIVKEFNVQPNELKNLLGREETDTDA